MRNHPITEELLKDKRVKISDVLKYQYNYDHTDKINEGTILHWAAQNNRFDIFKVLKPWLNKKLINQFDNEGSAPFHYAVKSNNIKLVENLLTIPCVDINF